MFSKVILEGSHRGLHFRQEFDRELLLRDYITFWKENGEDYDPSEETDFDLKVHLREMALEYKDNFYGLFPLVEISGDVEETKSSLLRDYVEDMFKHVVEVSYAG